MNTCFLMLRKLVHWKLFPLILLITANLVIGVITVRQFGESYDESSMINYGEQSLNAYRGLFQEGFVPDFDHILRFYGPVYAMSQVLIAKVFLSDWLISDVGHLVNFITFQVGLVAFYFLAQRWFRPWAAFCATLLFSTQPLFWGHAFINSKDIPFMTFFLISILTGLNMVDDFGEQIGLKATIVDNNLRRLVHNEWGSFYRWKKNRIRLFVILGISGLAIGLLALFSLQPWLRITGATAFEPPRNMNLEIYLRRLVNSMLWIFTIFLLGVLWFGGIFYREFRHTTQEIWKVEFQPLLMIFRTQIVNSKMFLAGIALGLTISIRALGFAAAIIVFVYAIWVYGKRSVHLFILYSTVAFLIVYISWPYLWPMPVVRLLMSMKVTLQFPWPGLMLFDGVYYPLGGLPWYSNPWLMIIQLTEPVVIFSLIGLGMLFWHFSKWKRQTDLMVLVAIWFFLPLSWSMLTFSSTYDNFRQLLFIIPPLFLLLGVVFEWLAEKIHNPVWRWAIPLLLIIPGILSGARLHPYEYIYYNQFVGGTGRALRQYEMDYWGTSYRAATIYLNRAAPENSSVYVRGPFWIVNRYAREDLNVIQFENFEKLDSLLKDNFYIILSSRYDHDLYEFSNSKTLHSVTIDGAVLAVVKIKSSDP